MKKYIYITILAGLSLLISCEDLDQNPQSFQPIDEYFGNGGANAAELFAGGLSTTLWDSNYGFNCRLQRVGLGGDDITTLKSGTMEFLRDLDPQIASNDADVLPLWRALTKVIYDANILIKYGQVSKTLTDQTAIDAEVERVKVVKAEAYFMRGLAYFYLIRLFGNCPLILDNDTDAETYMPLSSPEDIYTKAILPSLEIAIKDLPNKSRAGNSSLPSKWAAKTLLADVYITMAGWPLNKGKDYYALAAKEAEGVIDGATEGGLSLTPSYANVWKESLKKNANEHLFAIHHSVTNKIASQYGKSYYGSDFYPNAGWSDYFANINFFNNYPSDERKEWNYMTEWLVKQKDGSIVLTQYPNTVDKTPTISKYYDYDDGDHGKNALSNGLTPIYRYADALLIYAEASTLATGTVSSKALTALNDIQKRAAKKEADGSVSASANITTTTNPVAFEKAVFDEYGWEFFAEFRRWFQLIRKEKVKDVKPVEWEKSLFKKHNHYYMPIPNGQIELTGWTNNPGY